MAEDIFGALLPPPAPEEEQEIDLQDAGREMLIRRVLQRVLGVGGRRITLSQALEMEGVSTSAWNKWQQAGIVAPILDEAREQMQLSMRLAVLPWLHDIYSALAHIAIGQPPPTAPNMTVKPQHTIQAGRFLLEHFAANDDEGADNTERLKDFLEKYRAPQLVNVVNVVQQNNEGKEQFDFLYKGDQVVIPNNADD